MSDANDAKDANTTVPKSPTPPRNVDELLKAVEKEIQTFEAKKLVQLRGELDALVKKRDALLADYEKKYPLLCKRWLQQHQDIRRLHSALSSAVPKAQRQQLLNQHVCPKLNEVEGLEAQRQRQYQDGAGPREKERDVAQAVAEARKLRLDALSANAQRIEAVLNDGDKIIKEIQGLLPGPQTAVAVYLLWFKLLPLHMGVRPDTAEGEAAAGFAADETPDQWCPAAPAPAPAGQAQRAQQEVKAQDGNNQDGSSKPSGFKRDAAWLMKPSQYGHKLDEVWLKYRDAKDRFAEKDAAYQLARDDTASLGDRVKALNKDLDDRVRKDLASASLSNGSAAPAAAPGAGIGDGTATPSAVNH